MSTPAFELLTRADSSTRVIPQHTPDALEQVLGGLAKAGYRIQRERSVSDVFYLAWRSLHAPLVVAPRESLVVVETQNDLEQDLSVLRALRDDGWKVPVLFVTDAPTLRDTTQAQGLEPVEICSRHSLLADLRARINKLIPHEATQPATE